MLRVRFRYHPCVTSEGTLEPWLRERASVSEQDFCRAHAYAFLVTAHARRDSLKPPIVRPARKLDYHTQVQGVATASVSALESSPEQSLLLPVRKAPSNPFPERISIGRAPNCDIVLRHPSVSKLHGHFTEVGERAVTYADAGSSNGTVVDGLSVPPRVAVSLEEFGSIVLGRVRLQLLSASAVYAWLSHMR